MFKGFLFFFGFFGTFIFGPSIALADSPEFIEAETVQSELIPEATYECQIKVILSATGSFQEINQAKSFCNGLPNFCVVRGFSGYEYESFYRNVVFLKGSGYSWNDARRNAWNVYYDWFQARRFHDKRIQHSFNFVSCG